MIDFPRDGELLKRLIRGALVATIQAHGPITPEFVTSATKRVFGALKQYSKMERECDSKSSGSKSSADTGK